MTTTVIIASDSREEALKELQKYKEDNDEEVFVILENDMSQNLWSLIPSIMRRLGQSDQRIHDFEVLSKGRRKGQTRCFML